MQNIKGNKGSTARALYVLTSDTGMNLLASYGLIEEKKYLNSLALKYFQKIAAYLCKVRKRIVGRSPLTE